MRDRERLRRLGAHVAAGRPVDWDDEERAANSDELRAAIRELRVLAAVAAFGEAAQSAPNASDLSASVSVAREVLAGESQDGDAPSEPAPALAPGTHWGQVEILERIGSGAFGEVYRGRDTRLDRVVAIKLSAGTEARTRDQAVREARLLARVRHPNVVTVHGADCLEGRVGIWMEYLDGETLDRVLKQRGTLDTREATLIGIDLCRALAAVHAAGVAHRDVKLANVMRARGGRIVLMDFGLGHELDASRRTPLRRLSGTPLFMAPEVLCGAPGGPSADLYSVGVVLFALVTGRLPVEASSVSQLIERHGRRETRRVRDLRADVPETFVHVLDRLLDPDPATRFCTAGEAEEALLGSLGAAVATRSPADARGARRRLAPVAGVTLAVTAAAVAFALWKGIPGARTVAGPSAPFAATPDHTLVGEGSGSLFGLAVEGVGDTDKDGYDDVCIAAPLPTPGAKGGKVFLYRGTPHGLEARPSWTMFGADSAGYFGQSIAPRVDVDVDGFSDLVVGAPGMEQARLPGQVLVFTGSRQGLGRSPAQTLRGGSAGSLFGFALATGDVNHDGVRDLLVGEPYAAPARSGRAHLFLSAMGRFESTPSWSFAGPESSAFGIAVALGDINHDGYEDAVIGAPTASFGPDAVRAGAAYVFLGSRDGLSSTPAVITGRQPGALLGRDVVLADLDGDDFDDLVVGAEDASNGETNEGIAEVHFGSQAGVSPYPAIVLESNVMGANFGGHAALLGDVDGDGCDDLFVGAIRYQKADPRAGAAYVYRGSRDRILRRSWFRVGPRGGSWYGSDASAAGDVNGDGRPDLVVSAPSWDAEPGQNTGMVELFLGRRRR